MFRFAGVVALIALGGCAVDAEDAGDEEFGETGEALSSNATFNNPDDHFEQKVTLPSGDFGIYDRDGKLLAKVNSKSTTGWIQGQERVVTKSKGSLYWLWGFKSGLDVSGYVRGTVVKGEHGVPEVGEKGASNDNGRAADVTGKLFRVDVTPIPPDFHHATTTDFQPNHPGDVNVVSQYAVSPVDAHYAYLSWSTTWDSQHKRPLHGGGIVRSLVEDGTTFHAAKVNDVVMPAFSSDKKPIGKITWSYGFVRQNGERVFGWMIKSHQRTGEAAVTHLTAL